MWVKTIEEGLKLAFLNYLNARAAATLRAGKYNDGAGLLLHKRKEGSAQWLYRYTIHDQENALCLSP
ncbi:DUF4102 domain-containing protein [Bartonella acomydis]|uniref:DUF4102 domain-containing protein n=1 Tax=Bartonella acomydis TaxID=686234 RepID=UPI003CD0C2D6